jgi:hypothetical protein
VPRGPIGTTCFAAGLIAAPVSVAPAGPAGANEPDGWRRPFRPGGPEAAVQSSGSPARAVIGFLKPMQGIVDAAEGVHRGPGGRPPMDVHRGVASPDQGGAMKLPRRRFLQLTPLALLLQSCRTSRALKFIR